MPRLDVTVVNYDILHGVMWIEKWSVLYLVFSDPSVNCNTDERERVTIDLQGPGP